ncbi:hypothetical protein [Bdellovibrio bacteriovorus]|uniref:hypothetical protein n=1 Tax=Bdellovibrio bacteriovorus TaxID=959 RepID=UPI001E5809FB|nr:hypothetical protein [Bdellovibrio bacteriovorus]
MQGTTLPSKFNGVDSAVALSPTAIRLSWTLQSRFKAYRIYLKGESTPRKTVTFASTIVDSLNPATSYQFSVVGVQAEDETEVGIEKFVAVSTLENFTPVPSSGVIPQTNGAVEVNWFKNGENVEYQVFTRLESQSWNLMSPTASVVGKGQTSLTTLASGSKYCFWVVAKYGDGTSQPENNTLAYINSKAPCMLVQSLLPNLPQVKINMAFSGNYPWFWTENGDTTYKTEIFDRATDVRVASVQGNDYFRALTSIGPGQKDWYAKVSSGSAATIVNIGTEGAGAFTKPLIRSLEGAGAKDPLYPRLVNGGLGIQDLGQNTAVGDFNCDGFDDVAVTAPRATPVVNAYRSAGLGAVVVYYGYQPADQQDENGTPYTPDPRLKTDQLPTEGAKAPNPQLIYYPSVGAQARLGLKMAVGNANGDCYSRYGSEEFDPETLPDTKASTVGSCNDLHVPFTGSGQMPLAKVKKIHSCDDLAITTDNGKVFVIFGDPVTGLVSGSGGTSYGTNEVTCEPSSHKCRPVQLDDTNVKDVKSIAFGDFNNDGYDDLAIGVQQTGTYARAVHVLRGSVWGLYPPSSTLNHAPITAEGLSATGFLTDGSFDADLSDGFGYGYLDGFASALGVAYNSRTCITGSPAGAQFRPSNLERAKGFDFTKCDDLVIGVPDRASGRGSIVTCKGVNPTSGADRYKISSWDCQESYPDMAAAGGAQETANVTVKGYGFSIHGVKNQNGYPLESIIKTSNAVPDISGSLFVGAPQSTVQGATNAGVVFGYYMTPKSSSYTTGGIQGILNSGLVQGRQVIAAANSVACNSRNNAVATGTLLHCNHQMIFTSPAETGVQFGYSMGTVPDVESKSRALPSLAVSAPFRSVKNSSGTSNITNNGVVYLYSPDVSTFGTEDDGSTITEITAPVLSDDDTVGCTTKCTWYSGGINPFGPSIIYPKDLNSGASFGLGSLAGGDFDGDEKGDFVAGAPYVNAPAYGNGALFIFNSKGAFASSVTTASETIKPNFSKELNYSFEEGKAVGDVNGDGYDDVMTHIATGQGYELIIFYGSASGLITSPAPSKTPSVPTSPTILSSTADAYLGSAYHRIGSVNGDAYDDIMVIGSKGSYIFYGSSSGVVIGEPSINPVGNNPLWFARNSSSAVAVFHDGYLYGGESSTPDVFKFSQMRSNNRGVHYGDFNADGYSDIVVGMWSSSGARTYKLPDSVIPADAVGNFVSGNRGRLFVLYGGASGLQVNRATGTILLRNVTYDGSGNVISETQADVVVEQPCTAAKPAVCSIQQIASVDSGVYFGWGAIGLDSLDEAAGDDYSELLVSDPGYNSYSGRAYLYRGTDRGLSYTPIQKLVGSTPGEMFGYSLAGLGDVNGDDIDDVALSAPFASSSSANTGITYVFYGAVVGGSYAFYGATDLNSTDYFDSALNPLPINTMHANVLQPKPQRIQSSLFVPGDKVGVGLAAIGDMNLDGYPDLLVNAPGKTYDSDQVIEGTGAYVVYFGSQLGLRIVETPTPTPRCYRGGSSPICEPSLVYLPLRTQNEYTYLSQNAVGDVNGDGALDVVVGSTGRTHPSGQAYSTGVIYVLY